MKRIAKRKWVISRLKNAEHFELHEEIIVYTSRKIGTLPDIQLVFYTYKARFGNEREEFKLSPKSPKTEQMEQWENIRNPTLVFIHQMNRVAQMSDTYSRWKN